MTSLDRDRPGDEWRRLAPPAPTRVDAARPAPLYGLAAFFVVVAVISGVVVYSYVHLAVNSDAWPPPGVPAPGWAGPLVGSALVALAAAAGARGYSHASRRDDRSATARSLVVAGLAGAAATAAFVVSAVSAPYDVDEHSYAAVVVTATGLVVALLAAGTLASAVVLAWVVRGHAGTGVADAPRVVRAYWSASLAVAVTISVLLLLGGRAW